MIVKCLIFGVIALCSIMAFMPLVELFLHGEKVTIGSAICKNKCLFLIETIGMVGFAVFCCFSDNSTWSLFIHNLQDQILWNTVLLIAVIDYFSKRIPNKLILFIVVIRIVLIAEEIAVAPKLWVAIISASLIGLAIGALFMGTCLLLSRGGVGGGDLKLYSTLGLFYGMNGVIAIMLYSLLLAVLVGIGLLISHKAKFKTTLPMAPFILFGLTVYLLFV